MYVVMCMHVYVYKYKNNKFTVNAQSDKNIKDVMDAVSYLVSKNLEESFPLLKEIFFHPLTAHKIRLEIGKIIASTKNKQVYNLLDCKGIVRIDYILSNGQFYMLEINTAPGMSQASIIPQQIRAAGLIEKEVFSAVIDDAIAAKGK